VHVACVIARSAFLHRLIGSRCVCEKLLMQFLDLNLLFDRAHHERVGGFFESLGDAFYTGFQASWQSEGDADQHDLNSNVLRPNRGAINPGR